MGIAGDLQMTKPTQKDHLHHKVVHGVAKIRVLVNDILKEVKQLHMAADNYCDSSSIKSQSLIVSPTGGPVRDADNHGMGHFGAPRGDDRHKGADYIGKPGQNIVSPIDGKVIRAARPYADDSKYNGLLISGKHLYVKIFYIEPDFSVIGAGVFKGKTVIGTMQDIGKRYTDITPHVHLQAMVNPEYLRSI